jgi:hypothetical protein
VSGTPSEADVPRLRVDPPVRREAIRITNLYGTTWEPVERLGSTGALASFLRFGRLAGYYADAADQLPAVAAREILDVSAVRFSRWTVPGGLTGWCWPTS